MLQVRKILKTHTLRYTQSREEILDIFIRMEKALSQPEIEAFMHSQCDRVTIYRTLSTFLEHGILHKVLDDSGVMKYAMCATGCEEERRHFHDHVHFKCSDCGNTTCLDEVRIPAIKLPAGFDLREVNMLMQGLCPQCAI